MNSSQPKPKANPKWMRQFYFWTGIIATLAYRIIVVLNNYSPVWVQIAWYIGTIGFIIYFIHRYKISRKRSRLIKTYDLDKKVQTIEALNDKEKAALGYILRTLRSTKEKWNYIFIFAASGIALIWGIYADFIAPLLRF